jgi:hypothetical protein
VPKRFTFTGTAKNRRAPASTWRWEWKRAMKWKPQRDPQILKALEILH